MVHKFEAFYWHDLSERYIFHASEQMKIDLKEKRHGFGSTVGHRVSYCNLEKWVRDKWLHGNCSLSILSWGPPEIQFPVRCPPVQMVSSVPHISYGRYTLGLLWTQPRQSKYSPLGELLVLFSIWWARSHKTILLLVPWAESWQIT
jgi:hypothetical protein